MEKKKKKMSVLDIVLLQGVFFIYSISSVVAKIAISQDTKLKVMIFYCLDVAVLGIYALLWQQLIKRYELSIAYANKAFTLFWSLIWGYFLFHEEITIGKIVGMVLVVIGILILNRTEVEEKS